MEEKLTSIYGQVSKSEKNCREKLKENLQKKKVIEQCIRQAMSLRKKLDGIKSNKYQCTDSEKGEINSALQEYEKSLNRLSKDDTQQLRIRAANAERLANTVREMRKRYSQVEEEKNRLQILLEGSGGNQDEIIMQLRDELSQLPGLKTTLKELTQENSKIHQSYTLSEARIEQILKENKTLEENARSIEALLKQKTSDLNEIVESSVKLKSKLVESTKRADLYESECSQLEVEYEERIQKWKAQYEEIEKKAATESAESLRLSEHISKQENYIHKLNARNKLVETELEEIRSEQALAKEIEGSKQQLANEEQQKRIEELSNELDKRETVLLASRVSVDELQLKINDLQSQMEQMMKEKTSLQETLALANSRTQDLEKRIREFDKNEKVLLASRVSGDEFQMKINDLQLQMEQLMVEKASLQSEMEQMMEEKVSLKKTIVLANSRTQDLEKRIREFEKNEQALLASSVSVDELQMKINDLQSEMEQMMKEKSSLQESFSLANSRTQDLEKRISEFEVSAAAAADLDQELKTKINKLEISLEVKKQENEETVSKLENALKQCEEFRSKISEIEGLLVESENKNKKLTDELSRQQEKSSDTEAKLLKEDVRLLQEESRTSQVDISNEQHSAFDRSEKLLKSSNMKKVHSDANDDHKPIKTIVNTLCRDSESQIVFSMQHPVRISLSSLDVEEKDLRDDLDTTEENRWSKAYRCGDFVISDAMAITTIEMEQKNIDEKRNLDFKQEKTVHRELRMNLQDATEHKSKKMLELCENVVNEQVMESSEPSKDDSCKSNEAFEMHIRSLQDKITILEQNLSEKESAITLLNLQIEKFNDEITRLQNDLDSGEAGMASAKYELQSLSVALSEKDQELQSLSMVVTERETETKELKVLLAKKADGDDDEKALTMLAMERKIQILENVKSMVFKRNKEMQDKLNAAEETLKSLTNKDGETKELKIKLELSEKSLREKDSEMFIQKQQMDQENESLQLQLSTISKKAHILSSENMKIKLRNNQIESEVQRLRDAMSSKSQNHLEELSTLANLKREFEKKLETLSASSANLKKDLSNVVNGTASINALLTNATVDVLQAMCPDLTVGERCSKSDELLDQILLNINDGVLYKQTDSTTSQIKQLGEVILNILREKAKMAKKVNKLYFRFLVTVDDSKGNIIKRKTKPFSKRKGWS